MIRYFTVTASLLFFFVPQHCAQSLGVPSEGLVAFYPLNEGMANNPISEDLQGQIQGTPSSTVDRHGNVGGAMRFDQGDYITVPGSSDDVFLPFSVSLWYSPDPTDVYANMLKPLFKKYTPAFWRGVQVATTYREGSQAVIPWYIRSTEDRVIGDYGSPPFLWSNPSQPTDSSWFNVVFTVDSAGGDLYVNGQLADAQPWDGTSGLASSYHEWQLAGTYEWADSVGYLGSLDDVGIWNRALTADEVMSIYEFEDLTTTGCTDSNACNFNPDALTDDGSCEFLVVETAPHCLVDEGALAVMTSPEYPDSTMLSDSSFVGGDAMMDWIAVWSNGAEGPETSYDLDDVVGELSLLSLSGDTLCSTSFEFEVLTGCNNQFACNFNEEDECDVDCIFPVIGDDCSGLNGICGPGTYWNIPNQRCEIVLLGDTNFDQCVGAVDLIDMLTLFNTCLNEE